MKYFEINVNPKNRKTGDCSVRALCQATNIPYVEVLDLMNEQAKKTFYGTTDPKNVGAILEAHGFELRKMPRKANGTKYRVSEIDKLLGFNDIALIQVANHYTVVKGCTIMDSWNCGHKTIYRYWVKKNATEEELKPYWGGKKPKKASTI